MSDYSRALREPFYNVHFCGTESATEWQGYMDGAVESGERCANEVLYRLFDLSDKSVQIDYSKTYYHMREESRKATEKNDKSVSRLSNWTQKLFKVSFVLGLSYFIASKTNKNINFNISKMLKF